MTKITIPLETDEHEALSQFARHEKRDLRQQAAYFIRAALEQIGLLEFPKIKADVEVEHDKHN